MPRIATEKQKCLSRVAYDRIKVMILQKELMPGQFINESQLQETLELGRTPVREALRLLQEQGFVETVPYRGTYVTLLSLDNIKQMIYMRVAVETMVLRDFMQNRTPMVMEDIRHAIAQQRALIEEAGFEPEQFYHMDAQMHSIWFGAVKRQKLWEMLQAQQLHYTRFRMLDFITETDFERIIGEHEELFQLISQGDEKGLEESLKEHLYYSMKRMRHSIEVDYKDYFEEEPEEGRFVI